MKDEVLFEFAHMFKRSAYHNEDIAKGALKHLDRLAAIHKMGLETAAKLQRSPNLTANGKVAEFRKLGASLDKEIADIEKLLPNYSKMADEVEFQIRPGRHPREDVAWQLELREIRDYVRSLDIAEQEAFVLGAVEAGDMQILEAVRFSPIKFRFATEEAMAKIDAARQRVQFPEETQRLADIRRAQQEVRSALGSVKKALGERGIVLGRQDQPGAEAA